MQAELNEAKMMAFGEKLIGEFFHLLNRGLSQFGFLCRFKFGF